MADYACHAFPDEDNQIDSFLVGLISIAVALPVSAFIAQCFGIANDSEAPESLLEWTGWHKLVFGFSAHRRWLYSGPAGPPLRYVKWYVRSATAPLPETMINLWHSFRCWVTGEELPWIAEWREAQEEAAETETDGKQANEDSPELSSGEEKRSNGANGHNGRWQGNESLQMDQELHNSASEDDDDGVETSSVRSAKSLSAYKRIVMLAGFIGTYITWAIFAWFIFTVRLRY